MATRKSKTDLEQEHARGVKAKHVLRLRSALDSVVDGATTVTVSTPGGSFSVAADAATARAFLHGALAKAEAELDDEE
jgi:hypothetical protein